MSGDEPKVKSEQFTLLPCFVSSEKKKRQKEMTKKWRTFAACLFVATQTRVAASLSAYLGLTNAIHRLALAFFFLNTETRKSDLDHRQSTDMG